MINDELMPKVMRLLKFRGALTLNEIHNLTSIGKAAIRNTLQSMMKSGLISRRKDLGIKYELNENSKYWLGWGNTPGWMENK